MVCNHQNKIRECTLGPTEKKIKRLRITKICSSEKRAPQVNTISFPFHDSKAAKPTPSSSSHCEKDEKDPQEALREQSSSSSETEVFKRRKNVMISHLLWGVLQESYELQEEKWFIGASNRHLPLLLPCAPVRKESPSDKVRACLHLDQANCKPNHLIKLKQESCQRSLDDAPYRSF